MMIGITDTMDSGQKFTYYIRWLENGGFFLEWVKLSYGLDNLSAVERCDGVLLTGGGDVDPALYGGPEDHPAITAVDKRRDDFERNVIDAVVKARIPLLAICRGMQLVNVHLGGTLHPDIEEAGFKSHKSANGMENRHRVVVEEGSEIHRRIGERSGSVNSSHHQAVDRPGNGLSVTGHSEDGIIEAMETTRGEGIPLFTLIQWHPERMNDLGNPFTANILKNFLTVSSKQYSTSKKAR